MYNYLDISLDVSSIKITKFICLFMFAMNKMFRRCGSISFQSYNLATFCSLFFILLSFLFFLAENLCVCQKCQPLVGKNRIEKRFDRCSFRGQ